MGGSAFATATDTRPALVAPRLPTVVYKCERDKVLARISRFFDLVACPEESPGKKDYGDIDVVVAGPRQTEFDMAWSALTAQDRERYGQRSMQDKNVAIIMHQLSALHQYKNGITQHYALPYPGQSDAIIQVDLEAQPTENHAWTIFHKSYGDMWNILGTSIRPWGLTVSEGGLYVRDSMIEHEDKKRARTFASRDPRHILSFLNLSWTEWEKGWDSETDMFEYATGHRFFLPLSYLDRSGLKATDRQRIKKRPCFQRFVTEFLPVHYKPQSTEEPVNISLDAPTADDTIRGSRTSLVDDEAREKVLEEVLEEFGLRETYDQNHQSWVDQRTALNQKRELKAQRRREHEAHSKSYAQHWVDWHLGSLTDDARRALDLDMDRVQMAKP